MSTAQRRGWCPGVLRPMEAKDGLLARLRITGGILSSGTAHAIADLAERHSNGLFDLTARGNLQMRGVRQNGLQELQDGLHTFDLLDTSPDAEAVRNVIASPLAGLHDGPDIRPLVAALELRLAANTDLHTLPGKFGFLIDDGSRPSLAGISADVRFEWIGDRFAIGLGGARGDAVPAGYCDGSELVERSAHIARGFVAFARQASNARRMRDLIAAVGVDAVLKACGTTRSSHGDAFRDHVEADESVATGHELSHPALGDAELAVSGKRERDGARTIVGFRTFGNVTSCLGLAAPFGRLDAAMLRAAADLAQSSPYHELRVTPWRAILIPGVRAGHDIPGFITDPDDPRLVVAACVGAMGCTRGTTDTRADAAALAASLVPGDGIALHVSGCEKGCAKAGTTPVTLVGRDGRYDLVRNGCACDTPVQSGLDLAAIRRLLSAALELA